ncbi:hypothetical protein SUDANB140_06753 [Streptomyces sp. enrichment culture]
MSHPPEPPLAPQLASRDGPVGTTGREPAAVPSALEIRRLRLSVRVGFGTEAAGAGPRAQGVRVMSASG